ncbi:MAG: GNAT family N-acetyltransferase [Pseudonocardia sp.]|nr:GNAT family N-acetyltransferase [Pseudonocardia sp.]
MQTPVLTDGVVTLRAHLPADAVELAVTAADPATRRWTGLPHPYPGSAADRWIGVTAPQHWRERTAFPFAIEVTDGGVPRFAGNLALQPGPPPEIGYLLAPWARGRGIMSRAVRLATAWGFAEAGLPVLHWMAQAGNLASLRVAHACGFTFDGERPLALEHRGVLVDSWHASLRPGDAPAPRTPWWPVPTLLGERVRLRAHVDADVPRIVEACTDRRSRRWLPTLPHPYTADEARRFLRTCRLDEALGRRVSWAVADPADDRLLANVTIFDLGHRGDPTGGEIGYWAHPDARGRGIVGEAVQLLLDHAFTPVPDGGLGRERVQIVTAWSNAASRHVAERAGFTFLGRHRHDGVIAADEAGVAGAAQNGAAQDGAAQDGAAQDGAGDGHVHDDGAWYDLLATDPRPGSRP